MAKKMRMLNDVPPNEVRTAISDMCAKLGIPGSVAGRYSLYEAVLAEREKAIQAESDFKAAVRAL